MPITEREILDRLSAATFGTVVTRDGDSASARSMLFAFDGERDFFLLTHQSREKLGQIRTQPQGLLHLGAVTEDVVSSWDVKATGRFTVLGAESDDYRRGVGLLGEKNAMIRDLMASPDAEDWVVVRLRAEEITGWTYEQAVAQLPKTRLGGATP